MQLKTAIIAASRQPSSSTPARQVALSERSEQGQVISTLILAVPVLMLIFLVFFSLTVSQTSSVAQIAADAAVIHLQELDAIKALPPDDPNTALDERKAAFLELALSGTLIEEGRAEVYRRLCSSTRWIIGDACVDLGTNIPTSDVDGTTWPPDEADNPCRPPDNPGGITPLIDENQEQLGWPDIKVWISYPNLPVPVTGQCLSNPLDSIIPGTEAWSEMQSYPLESWRVVVLVRLRPVVPALMTFIVRESGAPVERVAISCGPIFLAGSDPDLWKC